MRFTGKLLAASMSLFVSLNAFAQAPPATMPPAATTPPVATTPPPPTAPRPQVVAATPQAPATPPATTTQPPRPRPATPAAVTPPADATAIPGPVWKKQVTRDIDLGEKIDTSLHKLRPASPDNTLLEMLAIGVKGGRVSAYTVPEFLMPNRINPTQFDKLFLGRPDTTAVKDQYGRYQMKISRKEFPFSTVHKYRIIEEWTSYPAIGKTEVQILGLAPLQDILDPAGAVVDFKTLFWVRYTEDVKTLIARFDQYHPNSTIGGHIWDDYFQNKK